MNLELHLTSIHEQHQIHIKKLHQISSVHFMIKENLTSRKVNSIMMKRQDSFWQTDILLEHAPIVEMKRHMATNVSSAEHH